MEYDGLFYASAVLKQSFQIIKKNIYPLLILAILFSIAVVLNVAFKVTVSAPYALAVFSLASSLISIVIGMSALSFVFYLCASGKADFSKLIPKPMHSVKYLLFSIFIALLAVPFVVVLVLLAGAFSFFSYKIAVISGIAFLLFYYYVGIFRMVFVPLSYIEGNGVFEGITASFELTGEFFFQFFALFIICLVLALAGSLFFLIGISVTAPVILVIYSCAYLQINGFTPAAAQAYETIIDDPEPQKKQEEPQGVIQPEENEEDWLGKGTDISDYSNVNDKVIDRSSLRNKEDK